MKLEFDSEWVIYAAKGDASAQTLLYNYSFDKVYMSIKSMISDEDLIQDVIQDTYIKAFASLDMLETPERFVPWVKAIARNKMLDELRKNKPIIFSQMPTNEGEEDELELQIEDASRYSIPENVVDMEETERLVKEILDSLSEGQRLAVGMYYYEELSVKEIAANLKISEKTVKVQLHRGRKAIEEKVKELEKRGTKLYSMAPLPFFLMLIKGMGAGSSSSGVVVSTVAASSAATAGTMVHGAGQVVEEANVNGAGQVVGETTATGATGAGQVVGETTATGVGQVAGETTATGTGHAEGVATTTETIAAESAATEGTNVNGAGQAVGTATATKAAVGVAKVGISIKKIVAISLLTVTVGVTGVVIFNNVKKDEAKKEEIKKQEEASNSDLESIIINDEYGINIDDIETVCVQKVDYRMINEKEYTEYLERKEMQEENDGGESFGRVGRPGASKTVRPEYEEVGLAYYRFKDDEETAEKVNENDVDCVIVEGNRFIGGYSMIYNAMNSASLRMSDHPRKCLMWMNYGDQTGDTDLYCVELVMLNNYNYDGVTKDTSTAEIKNMGYRDAAVDGVYFKISSDKETDWNQIEKDFNKMYEAGISQEEAYENGFPVEYGKELALCRSALLNNVITSNDKTRIKGLGKESEDMLKELKKFNEITDDEAEMKERFGVNYKLNWKDIVPIEAAIAEQWHYLNNGDIDYFAVVEIETNDESADKHFKAPHSEITTSFSKNVCHVYLFAHKDTVGKWLAQWYDTEYIPGDYEYEEDDY